MGETLVNEIQNAVLLFSNPIWSGIGTGNPTTIIKNITSLSSDIAYSAQITENITTLTARFAETDNGLIQGLLYVPDLSSTDPCSTSEKAFLPAHVVRQAQLPPTNYNLIAVAPWFSANCTKSYLESARSDPIRALITYIAHDNTTAAPPHAEDRAWNLHDGGLWKKNSQFPIYAVSGAVGRSIVAQLGAYSGNITEVPYGASIVAKYDPEPDDYVRIWTQIQVSTPTTAISTWIYILVCAALLLVIGVAVWTLLHRIHLRQRASLRKRVLAGEVNLEALNIAHTAVPSETIKAFPLFTYSYQPPQQSTALPSSAAVAYRLGGNRHSGERVGQLDEDISMASIERSPSATDDQPTCTICHQDFIDRLTIIREISCGHIFHPKCIDTLLAEISAACPVCKTLMLPPDFCPPITAEMVKRERMLRKLRPRVDADEHDGERGRGRGVLRSGSEWWTWSWRDLRLPWRLGRDAAGSGGMAAAAGATALHVYPSRRSGLGLSAAG